MISRLEAEKALEDMGTTCTFDDIGFEHYSYSESGVDNLIDLIYNSIGTCAECKFASFPYPHCMFPNGQVEGIVEDFFCSDFEKKTKGSKC